MSFSSAKKRVIFNLALQIFVMLRKVFHSPLKFFSQRAAYFSSQEASGGIVAVFPGQVRLLTLSLSRSGNSKSGNVSRIS